MIGQFNAWLASGALDSVGVTVVDINSLWNSGEYKGVSPYDNDNVHFSSLVTPEMAPTSRRRDTTASPMLFLGLQDYPRFEVVMASPRKMLVSKLNMTGRGKKYAQ